MTTYDNWISRNYPDSKSAYRQCEQATIKMVNVFPELKRVCGLAYVEEPYNLPPSKTPHWWCIDSNGNIIDPTAHQYPTKILKYEQADSNRCVTGRCMNCGDLAYDHSYFCCKECNSDFIKSLNKCS